MKQFLIKYRHTTGTTEDWHREIASFIASLGGDPALKGKIEQGEKKLETDGG